MWLFWLLLAASAWLSYSWGLGYSGYVSGIFFQNWALHMIFRGLLSISLALGSIGCFALKRKYDSNLALGCGALLLVISIVLMLYLLEPNPNLPLILRYIYYDPTALFNLGLLVFGVTLLSIRKSLPNPETALWIGPVFILISVPTLTVFLDVVWYWGFEIWLFFFGWAYAINAITTARLMLQIRSFH